MSLTPATSFALFNYLDPHKCGKALITAIKKNGWKVWNEQYNETLRHGKLWQNYSFNFNFIDESRFDYFSISLLGDFLYIGSYRGFELKQLIEVVDFLINYFGKQAKYTIGCWLEGEENYLNEVGKIKKLDQFSTFSNSYHFSSLIKAFPSFLYINYSILNLDELMILENRDPELVIKKKLGIFVFDTHFFESMEKGMVVGRSGYETKR